MKMELWVSLMVVVAILLPVLQKRIPQVDMDEVFCRTGTRAISEGERSRLSLKLIRAGLEKLPAEWFKGMKTFITGVCALLIILPTFAISRNSLFLIVLLPIVYFLPDLWLNRKITKRQAEIRMSLSNFTLLLSAVLAAGTNLPMGIRESAKATGGPLREEIEKALINSQSGKNLTQALADMAVRTDVRELNTLVRTLSQVHDHGAPLAETMENYSKQTSKIRRHELEKAAGKLSVTILLPVVGFILFPLMLVIGYLCACALIRVL